MPGHAEGNPGESPLESVTAASSVPAPGRGSTSRSPKKGPHRPRLTVSRRKGREGRRASIHIGDAWVLLGELNQEELHRLRRLVSGSLQAWDDPLEVWVPRARLLFRLGHDPATDLSSLHGFRRLGRFGPLADPDLNDPWLWERTTLSSLAARGDAFAVRREAGTVFWLLPLEGWGFFQVSPQELSSVEPGLFSTLGIDRMIGFLRGNASREV